MAASVDASSAFGHDRLTHAVSDRLTRAEATGGRFRRGRVGRFGGLYWLAGTHVGALLAGLFNAWIVLLAAGAHTEE
jgi:hypothetical protein